MLLACGGGSVKNDIDDSKNLNFSSFGLNGRIVYQLKVIDNRLFAATDKGLYRELERGNWELLGSPSWTIIDWAFINENHWILSTSDADSFIGLPTKYELYETLDNGKSWSLVENDFGGDLITDGVFEPIFGMHYDNGILFAVGYDVLASSVNFGRSWEVVDGFWGAFASGLRTVTMSPDKKMLWYGGQGGIENLVFRNFNLINKKSNDFSQDLAALLPSPSVILSILYSNVNEKHVFATAEGGIIQSRNGGENWGSFLTDSGHKFYFDLIQGVRNENHFYTAGWIKSSDPQPLVIRITQDAGETWQSYPHPDTTIFGGAYSMTSRIENNSQVLYIGLFKGGVIRVSNLP